MLILYRSLTMNRAEKTKHGYNCIKSEKSSMLLTRTKTIDFGPKRTTTNLWSYNMNSMPLWHSSKTMKYKSLSLVYICSWITRENWMNKIWMKMKKKNKQNSYVFALVERWGNFYRLCVGMRSFVLIVTMKNMFYFRTMSTGLLTLFEMRVMRVLVVGQSGNRR